mgnify:CR=1 FL=1
MKNIPNYLTYLRIILIPIVIGFLFIDAAWAAWTSLAFYTIASITDFLDGYLARKWEVESAVGKFLDPISDKIFIASLLVALVGFDRADGIWMIPVIIILMREFFVSGMREFLGPMNIQLPVSKLAKWKTTIQMIALGFLVMGNYGDTVLPYTLEIGQVGLTIAAILTVITGWDYLKAGFSHFPK